MSNTDEWAKRLESHRYSLDERNLAYKYEKEITESINKFLDGKDSAMKLGEFNFVLEPWRLVALNNFRKYGLKILEKRIPSRDNIVEITLKKVKQ